MRLAVDPEVLGRIFLLRIKLWMVGREEVVVERFYNETKLLNILYLRKDA